MSDLIDCLEKLRYRLDKSGVRRTFGLGLEMGTDCPYYKKSLDIFMKKDLQDIRSLLLNADSLIALIEQDVDNASG